MKKLQDLTKDELKVLYKKNHDFQNRVWENIYEEKMFLQAEDYKQILGENNNTIRYHDHYSSFYLTIENHDNFIENIDKECLTVEGVELYDKAKALYDKWANMTYDEQDENGEIYDQMEEANKALLAEIENILHSYESVEKEDIDEYIDRITEGETGMEEWETDGEKVYETIIKIYK